MKTLILSTLTVLALNLCTATAQQDYNTLILNHQIAMEMTFADVIAAWGNPQKVDYATASKDSDGQFVGATEAWHYPQTVVLFKNGRVSCIHECPAGK